MIMTLIEGKEEFVNAAGLKTKELATNFAGKCKREEMLLIDKWYSYFYVGNRLVNISTCKMGTAQKTSKDY